MQAKDLVVTGDAKVLGDLYTKEGKVATINDLPQATELWTFVYEDGTEKTKTVFVP